MAAVKGPLIVAGVAICCARDDAENGPLAGAGWAGLGRAENGPMATTALGVVLVRRANWVAARVAWAVAMSWVSAFDDLTVTNEKPSGIATSSTSLSGDAARGVDLRLRGADIVKKTIRGAW